MPVVPGSEDAPARSQVLYKKFHGFRQEPEESAVCRKTKLAGGVPTQKGAPKIQAVQKVTFGGRWEKKGELGPTSPK